jgi:hypothetical protein
MDKQTCTVTQAFRQHSAIAIKAVLRAAPWLTSVKNGGPERRNNLEGEALVYMTITGERRRSMIRYAFVLVAATGIAFATLPANAEDTGVSVGVGPVGVGIHDHDRDRDRDHEKTTIIKKDSDGDREKTIIKKDRDDD